MVRMQGGDQDAREANSGDDTAGDDVAATVDPPVAPEATTTTFETAPTADSSPDTPGGVDAGAADHDADDASAALTATGALAGDGAPQHDAAPVDGDEAAEPGVPNLPPVAAEPPPAVIAAAAPPSRGAETWYRTDQDRNKSVHRLANPWWRRIARGAIGLSFLALAGVGLYFGARVVQDYLDRDQLPSIGADVPTVRATTFEVRSTTPAPVLDGTLTLDAETGAFEYTGRGTGTQAGVQVVSPDGTTVYVRRGPTTWQVPASDDKVPADVVKAVGYLRNDDSADDILTSQLRRGYVDLVEQTELGEGDDQIDVYEVRLDTANFEADFPLQWQEFQDQAIPGVEAVRGLIVVMSVDGDNVLVGVDDGTTNWSWQRLSYTDQAFQPIDPADELLGNTIEIVDGNL